jgi:hypothetical protein
MAEKTQKCGSKTIRYPAECTYSCVCPPGNAPCTWTVSCPGRPPISGTGLTAPGQPPRSPHVTLDGNITACAKMLQEAWQRRVIVPANLRVRRIRKRTLRGTPEQIAAALGLQLGPKTPARKRWKPKGDSVWIKSN